MFSEETPSEARTFARNPAQLEPGAPLDLAGHLVTAGTRTSMMMDVGRAVAWGLFAGAVVGWCVAWLYATGIV